MLKPRIRTHDRETTGPGTRFTPDYSLRPSSSTETSIHPTAVVHPQAQLGVGVQVGPYCIVGPEARVGDRTVLTNNVVLDGDIAIGAENVFGPFVVAGLPAQHLAYRGEPCRVIIGNRNTFREFATVHRGTVQGGGVTRLMDDNFIMVSVHVGHDSHIGSNVIIANGTQLGGHSIIEDHVTMGGVCGTHQFTRVGAYAMIGAFSPVRQDVPPFCLLEGNPGKLRGLNIIGLKRKGFTSSEIDLLKKAYRILFRSKVPIKEALAALDDELPIHPRLNHLKEFLSGSKRGFYRDRD